MANEKPAPAPETLAPEGGAKSGGTKKLAMAAGIVVLLEVLTIGVTVKMASGPKQVMANTPAPAATQAAEKDAEVKIVDAKLPNAQGGRLYLYDLAVAAKVGEKNKEKVTELLAEREAEIKDQIRTIVASADPKTLAEPGLETIKRQIAYQIEQDIGKELIKEVLIPKCTAYPNSFN